jgi:hypothetical protein
VSPVRYELGFYTPEDDILHSQRSENLKPHEDEWWFCPQYLYPLSLQHPTLQKEGNFWVIIIIIIIIITII